MSNRLYHSVAGACSDVVSVLTHENSWKWFYRKNRDVQVFLNVQKTLEPAENFSDYEDADIECVRILITVVSLVSKECHSELFYLDRFEVECVDRLNYPEGFEIPNPDDYKNVYPDGVLTYPKGSKRLG